MISGAGLDSFSPLLTVVVALLLDRVFSEPRPHPLVWFGAAAEHIESKLNRHDSITRGVLATLIMVAPITLAVWGVVALLEPYPSPGFLLETAILWLVIGWQSMQRHARAVLRPLEEADLGAAKLGVAMIVSRDTAQMNDEQVSVATVESVLENANDCLFASLFWFAVAGPVGAIAHRLVNTLDAMWGYRTERYNRFGRCAARLDDAMGFVPARMTALSCALAGSTRRALTCWRQQAALHSSPNAGVVMATGAGALGIQLGGAAIYRGEIRHKATLGEGRVAEPVDITRAISLVNAALVIWLIVFALWTAVGYAGG